jgi:hypothetical protein
VRQTTKNKLASHASEWRHAGLIDDGLLGVLQQRWQPRGGAGVMILKALAIFAVFSLASSVLSFIGVMLHDASPLLAAFFLMMLAVGVWLLGVRMATDTAGRNPLTGQILITFALSAFFASLVVVLYASGNKDMGRTEFVFITLLTSATGFATAYRYALRWPQFLALLLLFHGIGSAHGYLGHGSYFADIADERLMAVVAGLAAALGVWHEKIFEEREHARHVGFGHLYIIFGLLYFNLSLWFLTIPHGGLEWVLVFTLAGIGQLMLGARLKDARFSGFGLVFLGIDIYTRLFEQFWDSLHKGAFFLVAGGIAIGVGIALERMARAKHSGVTA